MKVIGLGHHQVENGLGRRARLENKGGGGDAGEDMGGDENVMAEEVRPVRLDVGSRNGGTGSDDSHHCGVQVEKY